MIIQASEIDGVAVLALQGDFDAAASPEVFRQVRSVPIGRRFLVLDLSGVGQLYSAGISLLLDLQRFAQKRGIQVTCCGARPFVRELLRITMADRALAMHQDLESALDYSSEAS